jgi:hypothetical protein
MFTAFPVHWLGSGRNNYHRADVIKEGILPDDYEIKGDIRFRLVPGDMKVLTIAKKSATVRLRYKHRAGSPVYGKRLFEGRNICHRSLCPNGQC